MHRLATSFLILLMPLYAEVLPQKPETGQLKVKVEVTATDGFHTFRTLQKGILLGDGIFRLPDTFKATWPLKTLLLVGDTWIVTVSRHVTMGPNGRVEYWLIHSGRRS